MKRLISPFSLLLAAVSTIIGSGWLYSAFFSAELAGVYSILSWLIGGIAFCVIALVFAELSAMFPISGSSVRLPQISHGTLCSFSFAWIIWLTYMATTVIEVQAVLQYLSFFFPSLTKASGGLTGLGYLGAVLLMLVISVANVYSLRWLFNCNNVLTILKIAAPLLVVVVFISVSFSVEKFSKIATITPSHSISGIFSAIAAGGIAFSFNGFKQAAELAGEVKRPSFSLPFALVGSILIVTFLMIALQFGYLATISPKNLVLGWKELATYGVEKNAPIASAAVGIGSNWLLIIIYLTAILSPFAAGFMYCSAAARSLYGMGLSGHFPKFFSFLNPSGNPYYGVLATFLAGLLMFFPLPGWKAMVTFLTSVITVSYAIGPINLLAMRRQFSSFPRPFRLPLARVSATLAFFFCNLLTYWTGWEIVSKMGIAIGVGLLFLLIYRVLVKEKSQLDFYNSIWLWFYLCGMSAISYLGGFGNGLGKISFGWDFLIIGLFSIIVMELAVWNRLSEEKAIEYANRYLSTDLNVE